MKEEHFRLIADVGFNSVRIVLHPFRDGAVNEEYKLSNE